MADGDMFATMRAGGAPPVSCNQARPWRNESATTATADRRTSRLAALSAARQARRNQGVRHASNAWLPYSNKCNWLDAPHAYVARKAAPPPESTACPPYALHNSTLWLYGIRTSRLPCRMNTGGRLPPAARTRSTNEFSRTKAGALFKSTCETSVPANFEMMGRLFR